MMVSMFIMWNDVRKNRGPILISQKIFIAVLIANMSAIFFDLMGVLFSGTNFFFTHGLMRICVCLYYFAHSQIGYLWLLYVDFELYQDRERFSKQLIPYTIPQAVILLMVLLSFKTEWMYLITDLSVLALSLTYIPWEKIIYSLITVVLSGQLIGWIVKISWKKS